MLPYLDFYSKMKIEIYTDGACSGNPGPGGWAAMVYVNDELIETLSGNNPQTTNNVMELTAAIVGLEWVLSRPEYRDQELTLYSDSQYVVKSITEWIHGWVKIGYKGKQNVDLMKSLYSLTYESGATVNYVWVRAHCGNERNEAVDRVAVKERLKYV